MSSFISNHVLTLTITAFSKINGVFHLKKKNIYLYNLYLWQTMLFWKYPMPGFCKAASKTTVPQGTIILAQTSHSTITLQSPSTLHVHK